MPANTNLVLANPDFNSIEGSLKAFLRSQDRFKDYDFEGSNISTLVNLLAYNTYQNAFIANMAASEMFLDSAQLRNSVVSHAKELGYTPRSTRAAAATISVNIDPTGDPGVITMPRGTLFTTQVGSRSYTFSTDRSYTIFPINEEYNLQNIVIYEGFNLTERYIVTPDTRQRFVISNGRIDTRSLVVTVDGVEYKNATSILDLNSESTVYFVELGFDGKYEIVFGANLVGKQPIAQQEVKASYSVSLGPDANGARVFRSSGAINGHTNITVTTVSPAFGGSDVEGIESIRRNAPLLYQTRNRAVTPQDYKTLLTQEFPGIQAINVYGGETMSPPQYGRVFISIDTDAALGVSDAAKDTYYRFIKDKSPITIEPVFINPSLMFLSLASTVYYDYQSFDGSSEDITSAVSAAIENYNETELADFDRTFRYSHFLKAIDGAHPAIVSNVSDSKMVLSLDSALIPTAVQTIKFFNEIEQSNLIKSITSSKFMFRGKTCSLQDKEGGNIEIVTLTADGKEVSLVEVGFVDYVNGIVTISPFEVESVFGYGVRLYAIPANKNVKAVQNVLLNIDTREVTLQAVPIKK